jgi:hypothetical protein
MVLQLDPKTQQIVSVTFAIIGAVAVATPAVFPSYIPSDYVKDVIQTAGFLTFLWNIIHGAMVGFSSSQPGPWAPQDSPAVKAAMLADKENGK